MLVRDDGIVIGQPAHAWVSGQLARAWSPAPEPLEPVCLAAEQHDVGWQDADLAPALGEDGRPRSFMQHPRPWHIALWRGAADRMVAQSRYAALLVSLHGTSLYEHMDVAPEHQSAVADYLRAERARQAALMAGLDPAQVDRNRRLILALDRISLALCHGRATTLTDPALRVEPADAPPPAAERDDGAVPAATPSAHVTVAPWPFAAASVAVGCEGRRLEGRFADDTALRAALDAAPWVPLRWVLSPG